MPNVDEFYIEEDGGVRVDCRPPFNELLGRLARLATETQTSNGKKKARQNNLAGSALDMGGS